MGSWAVRYRPFRGLALRAASHRGGPSGAKACGGPRPLGTLLKAHHAPVSSSGASSCCLCFLVAPGWEHSSTMLLPHLGLVSGASDMWAKHSLLLLPFLCQAFCQGKENQTGNKNLVHLNFSGFVTMFISYFIYFCLSLFTIFYLLWIFFEPISLNYLDNWVLAFLSNIHVYGLDIFKGISFK